MSDPVFSADMFSDCDTTLNLRQRMDLAKFCNAKIEKLLGPEVWGVNKGDGWIFTSDFQKSPADTHSARLFNVQPIEKKVCQHDNAHSDVSGEIIRCSDCGVKLRIKWEPYE